MNIEMKEAFSRIKPLCDLVMVCPSPQNITVLSVYTRDMKKEVLQELQQYILFPFITHLNSKEIGKKYELLRVMVDAMAVVLENVTVNSFEMCLKIETRLLNLVFDKTKTGMVAEVPEELKLSVVRCLTALMLNIDPQVRKNILRTQVPLLAQAVFVTVQIAKLEKLRALRLASINCVTALTATHPSLTLNYNIMDSNLELLVVEMLSSILPGVLAALQDVATCSVNPGHAVVVAALDATHRIICLTMSDKFLSRKNSVTAGDFAKMFKEKASLKDRDVSKKKPQDIAKRSPEWYKMAGEKLTLVIRSLLSLSTHESYKVRKELAVLCSRIITECNGTMQPSLPLALDVLISLLKDGYPEVLEYCAAAVNKYFTQNRHEAMDSVCENFMATVNTLPRILNNIDSSRKLSALNVLHGYLQLLCDDSRPQRLTTVLSVHCNMTGVCNAILEAAAVEPITCLAQHATRDVTAQPPTNSPWCKLRHLDGECEERLRQTCRLLGDAECAELTLDRLLDMFRGDRRAEAAYVINWMGTAPTANSLAKRVLNTYLEEDVWYVPLEVGSMEAPITEHDTLDVTVYNPRSWIKDCVPEAQNNLLLCCLLTEGVGTMANTLKEEFQSYLLKTLCLVLERVGSKYEMLHLAGLKCINDIALSCGHSSVVELIRENADYFTNQITTRLKKAWNTQSALQILSVVMEYSDLSILHYLYGIVQDVLVQSCDKYYEKNLQAYLQVFLTFIECIQKWFPEQKLENKEPLRRKELNLLEDVIEFAKKEEESERLLNTEEFEHEAGKSVEDMLKEDKQKKEEDILDYDDRVTQEAQPLPQHIIVTTNILKRCLNFITSRHRDESLLALRVQAKGLCILRQYENELLPLVHQSWAPLVALFERKDPIVVKRSLELLVTMAELSRDFIRSRSVREVLPHIYAYLHKSANDSYLKDAGSAYRNSQAYQLQVAALAALPNLTVDLELEDHMLLEAMKCADVYLSNKQPRPLQGLAVTFFKAILEYDHGAAWHHLRKLCNNDQVLIPPPAVLIKLEPVVGTPYNPYNKDYERNINLIFEMENNI